MSVLDKFLDAIRLNDDFDDDDEFFDDEDLEALDEEKPKHRFFKKLDDDYDDDDDEEEYVKPERKAAAPKQTKLEADCKTGSSFYFQQDHSDEKEKQRKWHHGSLCDQTFFYGRYQRDRRYPDRSLYGCTESGRY